MMFYSGLNGDDCRIDENEYDGDANNFSRKNIGSRPLKIPLDFESYGVEYTGRRTDKAFLLKCNIDEIPVPVTFWMPRNCVKIECSRFTDFTHIGLAKENMIKQVKYLGYGHLYKNPFCN
jgi:hypothetical protein